MLLTVHGPGAWRGRIQLQVVVAISCIYVHYGFQDGKWVYRLIYQAAARHYFDRDLPTFERVRESFRLLTRPA